MADLIGHVTQPVLVASASDAERRLFLRRVYGHLTGATAGSSSGASTGI